MAAAAVSAEAERTAAAAWERAKPWTNEAEVRDVTPCVNDAISTLSNNCKLPPGMRNTYQHRSNNAAVEAAELRIYRACAIEYGRRAKQLVTSWDSGSSLEAKLFRAVRKLKVPTLRRTVSTDSPADATGQTSDW